MRIYNLDVAINGNVNTFTDLHNGIILYDGNYSIENCKFQNITSHPSVMLSGNGIYAIGEHDELNSLGLNIKGLGKLGLPTFENCNTGIRIKNMTAYLVESNMINVNTGISGQSFFGKNVCIKNNYIGCHDQGIFIQNYFPSGRIEISYNNIGISNPTQDNYATAGIKLYEGLQDNFQPSLIFFNKIFANNVYNGIIVNQCLKPEIQENQIMLIDYQTNINGLELLACQKAKVSCNYIIGAGASLGYSSSFSPKGITITSTTSSHINCNYLRDVYCGLNIEEICIDSKIRGNIFEDHSIGLRYNQWANTGPQEANGNQWLNPSMPMGALHQGAFPPYDEFTTDENNPILTPPNKSPQSGWFFNSLTPPKSCDNECWFWDINSITDSINSFDSLIAIHGIPSTEYEDEINWAAGRYLFGKILKNNEQYSGSLFQEYFDSISTQTGGLFEAIKQTKNVVWKTDSVSIIGLISLYDAVEIVLDSINFLDSLLNTGLNVQDSLQTGELLQQAVINYNSLNTQIHLLLNLIHGQAINSIDSLRIMNMSISDSLIYEENEKQVNEILLSILSNGNDTLTPYEIALLESIAAQCPVSGGLSVYLARSLLSGIFDTHYNDQLLCLQNGIIKNSDVLTSFQSNVTFSLKPIPSSGSLTLNWSVPTNLASKYLLIDITGRLIQSRDFNLSDNSVSIDLNERADGVYFLHITPEGLPASIHKIILVK